MSTLRQYRQRMMAIDPTLGSTHPIDAAGVTANSVTIAHLGGGRFSAGWGTDKLLLRANTTTVADRVRRAIDFDPLSGRFDFDPDATDYTDVTVTAQADEYLELHEHDPFLLDQAIQRCLGTTRFLDSTVVPMNQSGRYWLGDLTWVNGPGDIAEVYRSTSPVLTRNRHFEKWNDSSTGGLLVPDFWTLGGTNATFARDATNSQRGAYSLGIVGDGNVATVEQTYRVMESGVSGDSLRDATVTGVAVGRSGNAVSQLVRVTSEDAAGNVLSTTNSSGHDGDDDWQEMSAEHTVNAAAEIVRVQFRQLVAETGELDELYLCSGALTDDIRRDGYVKTSVSVSYEQGQPLQLRVRGGNALAALIVESYRPFHTLDATRVATGSADGDSHDAPLDLVARGGLWRFYEKLPDRSTDQTLAMREHRRVYERLALNYLHVDDKGRTGLPIPTFAVAGARRF